MDQHPLLRALGRVDRALDAVAPLDPAYLPASDKARALRAVSRELARLEGLRLELLAAADDLALEEGARSAGVWLAQETRAGAPSGVRDQRLAEGLDRWGDVRRALREGLIIPTQAGVIVSALDDLPDDLEPELLTKACAQLLADAGHFGPRELRILGRRVLEVIAPEVAEGHEERLLRAEERRARCETRLTFRPRGDGMTDVFTRLPDHVADRLRVYLDCFTAPRRQHLEPTPLGDVDLLPLPRQRGGRSARCSSGCRPTGCPPTAALRPHSW